MGGDLNLKKSWHPGLQKNQERVWQEEKKALEERKRTEQWRKEREEERQLQELRQIQEAAGGKKILDRVEFLYSGPAQGSGAGRTEEETEAYLLGKRRITSLLTGGDNEQLKKDAAAYANLGAGPPAVVSQRDTIAKVRDDPLLAIKRQEQLAYESYLKDPMKRQMLQRLGAKDGKPAKRHRSDDDRHRSRRHRSKSRSSRRRSTSRDRDDRRHRTRSASPRPDRDQPRMSTSPRRERSDGRDRERPHRSRSADRDRRNSHRRRSPDSRRDPDARPASDPHRLSSRDRRTEHSRRPSPPSLPRFRPPSCYSDAQRNGDKTSSRGYGKSSPLARPAGTSDEERAQRLAEMQGNASALDADRAKRLAALAELEKAQAAADDAVRQRNSRLGGRADFLASVNRKAAELDLGDRVSRGRQGLVLGED